MEHGAVSFKNFSLDVEAGDTVSHRTTETQVENKMHIAAVAAVNQKC